MHVSITRLKIRGFLGWLRFWALSLRVLNFARNAKDIVFCEVKSDHGYKYTLTVWKNKEAMLQFRNSEIHRIAMDLMPNIGQGSVFGYETNKVPSWDKALSLFHENKQS